MTAAMSMFSMRKMAMIFLLVAVNAAHGQLPLKLNLSLVASNKPPQATTGYGDVWGDGDIACLGVWTAYSTFGCGIYSISNPAAPQLLTVYNYGSDVGNRFEQGVIRSNILYVGSWGGSTTASGGSGVHILSITNPAAPVLLSRISAAPVGTIPGGFNNVHTLFLERNFLYLAAHNVGLTTLKVFNVSNPVAPFLVRDITTTNTTKVHQMTVRNKGSQVLLYTSGWGGNDNSAPSSPGQTDIWDVTNIGSQPAQWLGRVYPGYNSHSSWPTPDGNTLIVCREMPGGDVKFYDITNPTALTSNTPPVLTLTPASMGIEDDIPHNPVVVSNLLFLSWYQNGLQVFDITDRTNPVRIGFYDTYPAAKTSSYQGNWGVYPHLGFDRILLSDIQGGFLILNGNALLTPTNNYPPLVAASPANLSVTQGQTAVFAPRITGSLLNYQWRMNGTNLPGATTSNLTLINVQSAQAGNYSVVATNASGVVTSSVAVLSVIVPSGSPNITSQPQSLSVYPESPATLSVGVVGALPLSYQWRRDSANIPGATNSTLEFAGVQAEQVGYYSVVVSNTAGTATSSNALLALLDSPYLSNVRATPGARAALISWNSTVPSASQVEFNSSSTVLPGLSSLTAAGAQGSFSSASYLDSRPTTNHVILLTGLAAGTRYSYQVLSSNGTNTYVSAVYQFVTAGTNILDNVDASFTGSWTPGTSSTDKYSTNYQFATSVGGAPTATATWTPNISTPGKYDVYIWFPEGSNRATNAPYLISYNGGSTNVIVNQQTSGGGWRLIAGGVEFAKGTSGFVRLSNDAGPTVVLADAVRFVYVESQEFPTGATIIPAWWRDFFFGGTNNPSTDHDSDGYTTAQEYVMGTTPTDAASHLELSTAKGSNTVSITFWPHHYNRSYELLERSNLLNASWQPVSSLSFTTTPDGRGTHLLSPTNPPQNFYRLRAQMTTNNSGSFGLMSSSFGKLISTLAADEAFCGPYRIYVRPASQP